MLDLLFQIVVYPLYMGLEVIFRFFHYFFGCNIAITIFVISFIINLICLPLYINAEKLQKEEREIQAKLKKRVDCIKKNFKGDEKHMLLATYYRQNNYHPIMSLRTSLSLLLQIPFFTAAYFFFSHLKLLNGLDLWMITDLSKPDGLLSFYGLSINVLPIIMTVINLVAGEIYAKDQTLRDRIQIWIFALVFLVILYNSPSGLVLYWTCNNLFSLIKNIGLKCKSPKLFLNTILISVFIGLLHYIMKINLPKLNILLLSFFGFIGFVYWFFKVNKEQIKLDLCWLWQAESKNLYFLACIVLWLLTGLVIPSNLIASSPIDFSFIDPYSSPFPFIFISFVQSFGFFIFWGSVLYYFSSEKLKKILPLVLVGITFLSLFSWLFVPCFSGTMSNTLSYDVMWKIEYSTIEILFNNIFLVICFAITCLLFAKKKIVILSKIMSFLLIVFLGIGIVNFVKIYTTYSSYNIAIKSGKLLENKFARTAENSKLLADNLYSFSKKEKNVLIIMIDRAISSYLPLIFEEKPELKKIYTGFVYYPNTVSYYGHTIMGYPALMGGYEYTPLNLDKRDKEPMVEKHNQALLLLPTIFKNAGWNTTVTDAPWGDYQDVTPYKLFTNNGIKYENVKGKLGKFYKSKYLNADKKTAIILSRNMLYFSFMKVAPLFLKKFIYDDGRYLDVNNLAGESRTSAFLVESYAELFYLPRLTDFTSKKSSFIVINNELTHSATFLSYPSYKLTDKPNPGNPIDVDPNSLMHYHVNAAAWLLIGDYLEYLKKNNVYDNTRIIIVSDHGGMGVNNPYFDSEINETIMNYNSVLFVKDFNAKGNIKFDNSFMTNADVPLIAIDGIIRNPRNPFTRKILSSKEKQKGVYILQDHSDWNPSQFYRKNRPLNENSTFKHVKDNIFNVDNWSKSIYYKDMVIE